MAQFVIYPQANGEIAMIFPAPQFGFPIAEVAKKDVPADVPYLIVNDTDLPPDWEYSASWEADFSTPTGTGWGHDAWAMAQTQTVAEQENAQFDALREMTAGSRANGA